MKEQRRKSNDTHTYKRSMGPSIKGTKLLLKVIKVIIIRMIIRMK